MLVAPSERLVAGSVAIEGPLTLVVLWSREGPGPLVERRLQVVAQFRDLVEEFGPLLGRRIAVLSNLPREEIVEILPTGQGRLDEVVAVVGVRELSAFLDSHPEVRAALPSVLGVRDLGELISAVVVTRSSFDLEQAQSLARVFWSTRAYERAREVLARHRFVVLTGPPEMGKTAIARMLGLVHMTDGWEVHECSTPDALWRVFAPDRRQVFIADDAFGSTEYRPDVAERWAQALGRVLGMLDDGHVLIWTSRPAPLKAGLRRVQRERGSERFPSPAEVLVDASDLDLSEKTLILFRHAKARRAGPLARELIRSRGLSIVEHPHFTPERIRRLVSDRIDVIAEPSGFAGTFDDLLQRELAVPTDAMRTSYRALGDEHRALLTALLDAPGGLIDERELAGTMRRHHAAGLSQPMHELVDRLTDHFLRVTPLGVGWVHPSWRDLVIDELSTNPESRHRFLAACGVHGAILALSRGGGPTGERALPLLQDDCDWDHLGDSLHRLVHELEDREIARLLLALQDVLMDQVDPAARVETEALATELLEVIARRRSADHTPLSGYLVEVWYSLNAIVLRPADPPPLAWTWAELHPGSPPDRALDRAELNRLDEWLTLVETLASRAPHELKRLGFFDTDQQLFPAIIAAVGGTVDPDARVLIETVLARIERVAPRHYYAADRAMQVVELTTPDWWTPEDIHDPPTVEPVQPGPLTFTRNDVARVLADLD